CHADQCEYAIALEDGKLALEAARKAFPAVLPAVLRFQAELLLLLGRPGEAASLLAPEHLDPVRDGRDGWTQGCVAAAAADRERARAHFEAGAASGADQPWQGLLGKARCQRHLGDLAGASETLV